MQHPGKLVIVEIGGVAGDMADHVLALGRLARFLSDCRRRSSAEDVLAQSSMDLIL